MSLRSIAEIFNLMFKEKAVCTIENNFQVENLTTCGKSIVVSFLGRRVALVSTLLLT